MPRTAAANKAALAGPVVVLSRLVLFAAATTALLSLAAEARPYGHGFQHPNTLAGPDHAYHNITAKMHSMLNMYQPGGQGIPPPELFEAFVNDPVFTAEDIQYLSPEEVHKVFRSTFEFMGGSEKALQARFEKAIRHTKKFVIAVLAYSVAAGHDNYHSQSWPNMWERQMTAGFASLGVELEVRNEAVGGTSAFPRTFCMPAVLGTDVDVVVWEFSMTDAGVKSCEGETWMRYALSLPSRPLLMFVESSRIPKFQTNERLSPRDPGDRWPTTTWATQSSYRTSSCRPMSEISERYSEYGGIQAHDSASGIFPYYHAPPFDFRTFRGRGKIPGYGASWHPSPYGHLFRASSLAYVYLDVLRDALAAAPVEFAESPSSLPEPVSCAPEVCGAQGSLLHPWCALTLEPKVNTADGELQNHIINAEATRGVSWDRELWPEDISPEEKAKAAHAGHIDHAFGIAIKRDGPGVAFSVEVPATGHGRVISCSPKSGKGHNALLQDVAWGLDGQEVKPLPHVSPEVRKLRGFTGMCVLIAQGVAAGHHEVHARISPSAGDETQTVYVGFMIVI